LSLWLHGPNKNYFWEQDGHFVRIQALVVNKEYSGSLQFAPGVTSMTISIPIISDNINEPAETFEVRLSSASNANILDDLTIVTILEGAITTRAINSN
jgi:hypothetical protein